MPVKSFTHPRTGLTYKLGRNRPRALHPRLRLATYLMRALPTPPPSCDYSVKAMPALSQMYLNNKYGCCVPAWMAHATGIFTGNAIGYPDVASDTEIEAIYSQIGGFDPLDPQDTDNGCDEETALAYWQSPGIKVAGNIHQIQGRLAVDATDPEEVRTAIWLFENVMFGVELPDAWLSVDGPGFIWDVAGLTNPENGHCFGAMGYDQSSLMIDSWGTIGHITNAAVAQYAIPSVGGQLFTVLSEDSIIKASQKAPNGFNFAQLQANLAAFG